MSSTVEEDFQRTYACDFRLSMSDCPDKNEQGTWHDLYILVATTSWLVAIAEVLLLVQRAKKQRQPFFLQKASDIGLIRPKPIEMFLLLTAISNFLRGLDSFLIIADILKDYKAKELFFNVAWQFTFGGILSYLIGTVYSILRSFQVDRLSTADNGKPRRGLPIVLIDLFAILFMVASLITVNFSFLSGLSADKSDESSANFYMRAHYGFWSFYFAVLGCGLLCVSYQLNRSLDAHVKKMKRNTYRNDDNSQKFHDKILKVKVTIRIMAIMCGLLALTCLLYTLFRKEIHAEKKRNLYFGLLFLLMYPIFCVIITILIILSSATETTSPSQSLFTSRAATSKDNTPQSSRFNTYQHSGLRSIHLSTNRPYRGPGMPLSNIFGNPQTVNMQEAPVETASISRHPSNSPASRHNDNPGPSDQQHTPARFQSVPDFTYPASPISKQTPNEPSASRPPVSKSEQAKRPWSFNSIWPILERRSQTVTAEKPSSQVLERSSLPNPKPTSDPPQSASNPLPPSSFPTTSPNSDDLTPLPPQAEIPISSPPPSKECYHSEIDPSGKVDSPTLDPNGKLNAFGGGNEGVDVAGNDNAPRLSPRSTSNSSKPLATTRVKKGKKKQPDPSPTNRAALPVLPPLSATNKRAPWARRYSRSSRSGFGMHPSRKSHNSPQTPPRSSFRTSSALVGVDFENLMSVGWGGRVIADGMLGGEGSRRT